MSKKMSKAIEKMKQIISEMPKCKEKQQAEQGIKNLEIFEIIADSFEVIEANWSKNDRG